MSTSKLPTTRVIIFLSGFLLLVSTASAFNITKLLERDPSFSNFSTYLNQTRVNVEMTTRSPVTVLAIPNDKIGDVAGKPADVTQNIMRTHVLLDYFDIIKLEKLNKPTIVTTLYQTTGAATYQQGYLNITKNAKGEIVFSSAVHGAPHDVVLLGSVVAQPFNVSVLSVSGHIVTPGVEPITFSPPPPAGAPAPSKAKVHPPAPGADAPSPSDDDDAEAPASDAPVDAPATSPPSPAPVSNAPAADAADAESPKSASSKNFASISLGLLVVLASFFATN